MKILCVIDSLVAGGAQRQMVELAKGFKERGHEVSFLVYHELNFFKQSLDAVDISVTAIVEPNHVKRLLKMRRYIRNGNFDSVLSFLSATNFISEISALPWRKWKLVVGERSANPNLFKLSVLKAYRWFHVLADYVVANSHENIQIVKKINPLIPKAKFKVIYNIVDFNLFSPAQNQASKGDGKFTLVVPSSLRKVKNLDGLIEGVNRLSPSEKERLKIEWYGNVLDDSLERGLVKIENLNLSGIFKFNPPIPNIHEVMQKADAVGLFSLYEGLPNAVCEGMASGKPVLASRVSDVPGFLGIDERCMCNPNDYNEIKNVLSWALSSSAEELAVVGQHNLNNALLLFDKENIVDGYLDLLKGAR